MSRQEKLDAIVRKIDELLETASKRTPGEWRICDYSVCRIDSQKGEIANTTLPLSIITPTSEDLDERDNNAQYIAACAGSAEAGWIATKESIHALRQIESTKWNWDGDAGVTGKAADALDEIINAWEGLV